MLGIVISGSLLINSGSLFGSVLLSTFKTIVIGTNLTVVVSGLNDDTDDVGFFVVVIFWWWVVLADVGFGDDESFVVFKMCVVDDADWIELAVVVVVVVDEIDEPNEKCGIVFWSILFSKISGSTMSVSSCWNES